MEISYLSVALGMSEDRHKELESGAVERSLAQSAVILTLTRKSGVKMHGWIVNS